MISKTKIALCVLLAATVAVSGCGRTIVAKSKRPFYDGVQFKTRTKAIDKKVSVADFSTQIFNASKSLEGARKAAHHEGIRYCIAAFGSSDIIWQVDPLDPEAQLTIVDDVLTVQGKCDP